MQKRLILALLVVLLAIGGLYYYKNYMAPPSVDFAKLKLFSRDGQPFDLNSLKGKKIIINMYASWCGNCREELVEINKIKNAELSDVEIICISDEPFEKINGFADHFGYTFRFLKMEQRFPDIGIMSIPVTYFLNGELKVVEEKLGYIPWDDASTVNHLKSLL